MDSIGISDSNDIPTINPNKLAFMGTNEIVD